MVFFRPAGIYGPGDLRFRKLFKGIKTGRFAMIGSVDVKTQRMGMGANAEKRVPNEVILIGVKAVAPVDLSEAD